MTLPLLRGPLVAAGAVLFAASMESFAVPVVLGVPAGFAHHDDPDVPGAATIGQSSRVQ